MSDLFEKLEQPARSRGGRASASRSQLLCMGWTRMLEDGEALHLEIMGEKQTWRRVSGSGLSAQYERES